MQWHILTHTREYFAVFCRLRTRIKKRTHMGLQLVPPRETKKNALNFTKIDEIMILVYFNAFFSFLGVVPAESPYGCVFLSWCAERQTTPRRAGVYFRFSPLAQSENILPDIPPGSKIFSGDSFFWNFLYGEGRHRDSVWSSVLAQLKAARDRCDTSFTWFCSIFSLGGYIMVTLKSNSIK